MLAPGNVFSVGQGAGDMMRFNVAQMGNGAIEALAALSGSIRARPAAEEPGMPAGGTPT